MLSRKNVFFVLMQKQVKISRSIFILGCFGLINIFIPFIWQLSFLLIRVSWSYLRYFVNNYVLVKELYLLHVVVQLSLGIRLLNTFLFK